jgi:L-gulonate 3-dehydrogenase
MQPAIAAIIGAGLIGRAWAMVFARAGWRVQLYDSVPTQLDLAGEHILTSLAEQEVAGLIDDGERAAGRVFMHERIEDAVAGATWVQENLPENVEIKRDVFRTLDAHAPEAAVLASSTSAIPASQFTEALAGRARCLVAHPVNPPHLVPVVELCGAEWTSYTTIEHARTVMEEVGQVPIIVRRELDGFILNRLQGALLSEAMRLVSEGYVSPEDLDKTVAHGLGLRWSFMGPFATIELNAPGGVADYCARYGGFYRRLAADPPVPEIWDGEHAARIVAMLGEPLTLAERERKMIMRDRRLLALARHKREQSDT